MSARSHIPSEAQDLRMETARVLVMQARQLLLGLQPDPIPADLIQEAQAATIDTINKIRRCQSHRLWRLNDLERGERGKEPQEITIDMQSS